MKDPTEWTPARIQKLRRALDESTTDFGARFGRSRRAIEEWEQGRRAPNPFVRLQLDELTRRRRLAV